MCGLWRTHPFDVHRLKRLVTTTPSIHFGFLAFSPVTGLNPAQEMFDKKVETSHETAKNTVIPNINIRNRCNLDKWIFNGF